MSKDESEDYSDVYNALPNSLEELVFGENDRNGIPVISNRSSGFSKLKVPLNAKEVFENIQYYLFVKIDNCDEEIRPFVQFFFDEVDKQENIKKILIRHRNLFYSWISNNKLNDLHRAVINNDLILSNNLIQSNPNLLMESSEFSPLHITFRAR